MNDLNLIARRHRLSENSVRNVSSANYSALSELTRAELLKEALFDAEVSPAEIDNDRLREEVRWRRAAILREPGYAALAKLLAAVSDEDTLDTLTQGDLSPAQLIEKTDEFILSLTTKRLSRIPDLENHEHRIAKLEATLFSDHPLASDL